MVKSRRAQNLQSKKAMAKISSNNLGNDVRNSTCSQLKNIIVDIAHLRNKLPKANEIERKKELRLSLKDNAPSPIFEE